MENLFSKFNLNSLSNLNNYFFVLFFRHIRSSIIMEHGHNKYTRPADVRWITIEDLEPDRQYQFWVTAVTSAGEVGFIYGIAWLGL